MINPYELEKQIRKLIRFGLNKESIYKAVSSDYEPKDHGLIAESVERVVDSYPDYDLIQFFMDSKIIIDKDAEYDKLYMYNVRQRKLDPIDKTALSGMIAKEVDWSHRRHTCRFVYDPLKCYKIGKIDGEWKYNLYEPPFWQEENFYSEGRVKIPKLDSLPEIYDKFFNHLVRDDSKSFNYVLDWLANGIRDRNYCILTTIGNQGVGKGVLGNIMMNIFGEKNYTKTDNRVVNKDFNAQLLNKRFVYVDEAHITKLEQESKIKDMVNDNIEVERKGYDAQLVKNYSSIYFSSNNMDAIRLTEDDRRFSIVELNDKKLIEVLTVSEIGALLELDNIKQLVHYLYYRPVDKNRMMKVFKSSRTELLKRGKLKGWEEWFVDEYYPKHKGKTVSVSKVTEDIGNGFDMPRPPGRTKLEKLSEVYSNHFKIKNIKTDDGDQQWSVIFSKKDIP